MNKFGMFNFLLIVFVLTMIMPSYGEEIPKTNSSMHVTISIQPPNVGTPFDPSEIHIIPNSTVTWINNDNVTHTVTSGNPQQGADGKFDSGLLKPGKEFSYTFAEIGTFNYYCQVHHAMKVVIVNVNAVPEFLVVPFILVISVIITLMIASTKLQNKI
ncbi:MAG: hypothetical protein E6L02_07785 [Thaumarchaeota archaeon]|nr:MAG: hypothetical protein E6L02_07785 [Nitrososphaerota archaeon]